MLKYSNIDNMGKSRLASIPYVIEKDGDNERAYDIYSRLLENRIILIGEEISTELANSIIAQLLLLDERDSSRDICLYINSPGGEITAGLAIFDTLNYIKSDIRTVVIGMACSMAAVLAASGTKGKRNALPNSYMMIHQPRQEGSRRMTVTEQEIDLRVIKKMKNQLTDILSNSTNKSYNQIYKDCEMDKWFSAEEALQYGLIDEIIYKKKG